jgi:NhaA family Na+:H+ antiporter
LFTVNSPIVFSQLGWAGCGLIAMLLLRRARAPAVFYAMGALVVCVFALKSGINTSVAAVAAAFTVPVAQSSQLQRALRHFSDYIVLPIFALAGHMTLDNVWSYVPVGIALGLVIGKPIGVLAASYLVVWTRLAKFPAGAGHMQLFGVACLCGIGFTMSLFMAALAFDGDVNQGDLARLGIIMGSILALIVGGGVLALTKRKRRGLTPEEQLADEK